uniref:Protein kinase domain-containing protein n=2 Tax=Bionectria ochroleuca TaxID=29856 RepID=A0A0B7JXX0_BIOOC
MDGTMSLPPVCILELASEKSVASTLSSSKLFQNDDFDEVIDYIAKKTPRLFLSLIFAGCLPLLEVLVKNNFTDDDLPIAYEGSQDSASEIQKLCETDRLEIQFNSARPSKYFSQLDEKPLDDFIKDQWAFLAHVFPDREFSTYVFHPSRRFPYSPPANQVRHAGSFFSVVWNVILHDYDSNCPSYDSDGPEVAIKSLSTEDDDSGVKVDEFYKREVETLKKMADMAEAGEKHLIRAIAAYGSGTKRHFIFPWARGGNLDQFWQDFDASKSYGRENRIEWSLEQMIGVSRALTKLHESGVRHGDIKPQNILHFTYVRGSASGDLVISDVGLAKYHEAYTLDRTKYTTTKSVTVDYQPPEPEKLVRSRVYDNWSLGCVFLEFTIWIVEGYDGLSQFRKKLKDKNNFKRFWAYGAEDVPEVHHVVLEKMDELRKEAPLAYLTRPMVDLIETKLLIAGNTYNPSEEHRILEDLADIKRLHEKISRDGPEPPQATDQNQQDGSSTSMDQERNGISNKHTTKLKDEWQNTTDRTLANQIISELGWPSVRPPPEPSVLCEICNNWNPETPIWELGRDIDELKRGSQACSLCRLLLQCLSSADLKSGELITLFREEQSHGFRLSSQGPSLISLYSDPGPASEDRSYPPPGLPLLPSPASPQQFQLLNSWIHECDGKHKCMTETQDGRAPSGQMPTRMIAVGKDVNSTVRLVESALLPKDKYVALSHRWGDLSQYVQFCTLDGNIDDFKERIPYDYLPKSFQDAIRVTRAIGVPYLWIDSLCIIQGNTQDWKKESSRMEDVFNSAYCVLAATSAASSLEGFLGRTQPRESVTVQTSKGPIYMCRAIDDFDAHVQRSLLNSRGWVLQERALARRTLHFTSTQIYWECGETIHCETLAQLKNPQSQFLGDADFPNSGLQYYKDERIRLIQHLYELYSGLGLSYPTDRPKAILGLERRLGRVFKSQAQHGIFGQFFFRMLLWRAQERGKLTRIFRPEERRVPSWSWMACAGAITYMDVPFNGMIWLDNLKNPFTSTEVELTDEWDGHLSARANDFITYSWSKTVDLVLDFEVQKEGFSNWKCVLLGKEKGDSSSSGPAYYVLLIRVVPGTVPLIWQRIGVAKVNRSLISPNTIHVLIG